jgi:hypothetical protein
MAAKNQPQCQSWVPQLNAGVVMRVWVLTCGNPLVQVHCVCI